MKHGLIVMALWAASAVASDGALRFKNDPKGERTWMLTASAMLVFDDRKRQIAQVELPGWTWVGESFSCPADFAFGPKGEVVVSSNIVPTLWRIDPASFAVTVHPLVLDADTEMDVGFSGMLYSVEQGVFYAASHSHGSLWRIDPLLRRAQKIALSEPLRGVCELSVRPSLPQRRAHRLFGLCARTDKGGRMINFAPDRRSAYVVGEPCMN